MKLVLNSPKVARTQRTRILMGLTLFATLITYGKVFYFPKWKQISELRKKEEAIKKDSLQLQNKVAEFHASEAQSSLPKGASSVQEALSLNDNFTNLLRAFSGDDKSFSVSRISTEKQELYNEYTKTPFKLEVETSFVTLGQFIEKLELSPLLLDIKSIEVSRISHELKKCTAKIQINAFVSKERK